MDKEQPTIPRDTERHDQEAKQHLPENILFLLRKRQRHKKLKERG